MKSRNIPNKQEELNSIISAIVAYADKREEALIAYMYRENFTVTEIARAMKVSKQAVSKKFPKNKYVK